MTATAMSTATAIIIAESETVALITTAMLEALRCCRVNLLRAETLAEAIVKLKSEQVDIVIVDVTRPNGAGIEKTLKPAIEAANGIPVVAVTSDQTDVTKAAALAAGAAEVFRKGREWDTATFGQVIAKLVGVVE